VNIFCPPSRRGSFAPAVSSDGTCSSPQDRRSKTPGYDTPVSKYRRQSHERAHPTSERTSCVDQEPGLRPASLVLSRAARPSIFLYVVSRLAITVALPCPDADLREGQS
jgi:hypothetical protein